MGAADFTCSNPRDVIECADLVDRGGIVIFPTDTVYGIGCDPSNESSIIKLYKLKNRPLTKTLPLLTFSQSMISEVAQISEPARKLMDSFWPGQLTIILNSLDNRNIKLSKYVFDEINQSIALRIPGNECIQKLIEATKTKFLVGTSANISSYPSSNKFSQLDPNLVSKCDAVMHNHRIMGSEEHFHSTNVGRKDMTTKKTTTAASNIASSDVLSSISTKDVFQIENERNGESTIIDLTNEQNPRIVRQGVVPKNKIIEALKIAS